MVKIVKVYKNPKYTSRGNLKSYTSIGYWVWDDRKKQYVERIHVPQISRSKQKPFIKLVDQILKITSQPDYDPDNPPAKQKELEVEIDKLVYGLYGLNEEEVKIVEKYE